MVHIVCTVACNNDECSKNIGLINEKLRVMYSRIYKTELQCSNHIPLPISTESKYYEELFKENQS